MLQQLISSKRILRAQLLEFLGFPETSKEKKEILVPLILSILETDPATKERFLEKFKSELAVEPYELMQILQCSKTERKRWIKEGKIPILEYRYFRQSGIDMEYPVHDRRVIISLSQEEIQQWREEHKNRVKENRKIGSQVAAQSRKENEGHRQNFINAWEKIRQEWRQKGSAEISAILQLAYWTVWASRWAKENQIKSQRAVKNSTLYDRRKEEWYERKNEAVELLFKTSYASLSFYRPEEPDKLYFSLCDRHYNVMQNLNYYNKWDFLYFYHPEIQHCPNCIYKEDKDYYSFYYLEVKDKHFPEYNFSFHTPYPIGKDFLPEPDLLPQVNQVEQDGIFRFGRPLLEYEKIIHREKDVFAALEKAIAAVKQAGDRL